MLILFSACFIFLVSFVSIVWKLTIKSQTPRKYPVDNAPDFPYENVSFKSGKDQVNGWFIPAKSSEQKSPLIILVHGWGSNRAKMKRYVKPLYEAGYALLLFDVRSHGESDSVKAPTVKIFRDDVIAAIHYAKSRNEIDPHRIGILAHSFGGFGSVIAIKEDIGIKAVVADSIPVQFSTVIKAALKFYKLPYYPLGPMIFKMMLIRAGITRKEVKEFDVPQALKNTKSAVLLIHSIKDDFVPSSELDYILRRVDVPHIYVESQGHRSTETDPQYWKHVLPFFKKNLMVQQD
ncbi:alpha/beta fold hydrolase [Neobacillus sp. YIM B06451]|uniref:alpha/beta hydrolase n=1 Tax=Neobacillus sp. YIM B06451 TaxID=3070994 RepID=UPI00292E42B2|nr:alpha/beta fold hydrolase [Neobacillus sp. YIM B06451]